MAVLTVIGVIPFLILPAKCEPGDLLVLYNKIEKITSNNVRQRIHEMALLSGYGSTHDMVVSLNAISVAKGTIQLPSKVIGISH